jgi:hypothetical protein
MKVTKEGIERDIKDSRWPEYEAAGWKPANTTEQAGEELIRLKPPVKPKATETALEEATNLEGDE